jgi:rhodanese-related sulfurtransferase
VKEICNLSEGPVTTAPREGDKKSIPLFFLQLNKEVQNPSIYCGLVSVEETLFEMGTKTRVVDIRSALARAKKPVKHDFALTYPQVIEAMPKLDRAIRYVIVCESGSRGEELALRLKKNGFNATSTTPQTKYT